MSKRQVLAVLSITLCSHVEAFETYHVIELVDQGLPIHSAQVDGLGRVYGYSEAQGEFCRRNLDGAFEYFGFPDGMSNQYASWSSVSDASDSGTFCGSLQGERWTYRFVPGEGFHVYPRVHTGTSSTSWYERSTAMNNSGVMVGSGNYEAHGIPFSWVMLRWASDGSYHFEHQLPNFASVSDINDLQDVAGVGETYDTTWHYSPGYWELDGTWHAMSVDHSQEHYWSNVKYTHFGTRLTAFDRSHDELYVWSIDGTLLHREYVAHQSGMFYSICANEAGLVGVSGSSTPSQLWSELDGLVDFSSLLDSPSSAYSDISFRDMNDLGQITATARLNGEYVSVLLQPVPEPASLIVLTSGIAMCIRRRRPFATCRPASASRG